MLGQSGISNDTTVILYGDNNNWFAAYALWQLKYYGHKDARLMNGGRKKWLEEKRPLTTDAPKVHAGDVSRTRAGRIRARPQGRRLRSDRGERRGGQLVDVRSVDEFTGKIIAPPGMSETAQRAGHIPTAANIPWAQAANEDGTFKIADQLQQLYEGKGSEGLGRNDRVLPDRRTQFAYLVRAEISARL